MKKERTVLTKAGLKKLKEKLEFLKGKKREELQKALEKNLAAGDTSENEGYEIAADEHAANELEIKKLSQMINEAKVVKESESGGRVTLGNSVKVKSNGETVEYEIVEEQFADPLENKVSHKSPIGVALLGKKKGEKVEVELPRGTQTFEIVEIL